MGKGTCTSLWTQEEAASVLSSFFGSSSPSGKGKGGARQNAGDGRSWISMTLGERWKSALDKQQRNTRDEWVCSSCHQTNWLTTPKCRHCQHTRGWLLQAKGPMPEGPARPVQQLQISSSGVPPSLQPPAETLAGQPKTIPVTEDVWTALSAAALKQELVKLETMKASLHSMGMSSAVSEVASKIGEIQAVIAEKTPSVHLLDQSRARCRKAAQYTAKVQNQLETLQAQVKQAEAELVKW